MEVKDFVTESVMEYAFNFRLPDSVFSNVSSIYYKWQ